MSKLAITVAREEVAAALTAPTPADVKYHLERAQAALCKLPYEPYPDDDGKFECDTCERRVDHAGQVCDICYKDITGKERSTQ